MTKNMKQRIGRWLVRLGERLAPPAPRLGEDVGDGWFRESRAARYANERGPVYVVLEIRCPRCFRPPGSLMNVVWWRRVDSDTKP